MSGVNIGAHSGVFGDVRNVSPRIIGREVREPYVYEERRQQEEQKYGWFAIGCIAVVIVAACVFLASMAMRVERHLK